MLRRPTSWCSILAHNAFAMRRHRTLLHVFKKNHYIYTEAQDAEETITNGHQTLRTSFPPLPLP